MTRRITAFILTCIIVLVAVVPLSACAKPAESAQTQEEFQTEFVEMLKELDVFVYPEDTEYLTASKIVNLGDGVEIFEDDLMVALHVYELSYKPESMPPSAEEIESLYIEYNDEIYNRLQPFYVWYTRIGAKTCSLYYRALMTGNLLYKDKQGYKLIDKEKLSQVTIDEKYKLEEYIKENPDYMETDPNYLLLLKWLGLEK